MWSHVPSVLSLAGVRLRLGDVRGELWLIEPHYVESKVTVTLTPE